MLIIKEKPRDIEKEYEDFLAQLKKTPDMEIEIDEIFLYRVRVGIAHGVIDHNLVKVTHTDGTVCNVDKSGRLDRWPTGMFDKHELYLMELFMGDERSKDE